MVYDKWREGGLWGSLWLLMRSWWILLALHNNVVLHSILRGLDIVLDYPLLFLGAPLRADEIMPALGTSPTLRGAKLENSGPYQRGNPPTPVPQRPYEVCQNTLGRTIVAHAGGQNLPFTLLPPPLHKRPERVAQTARRLHHSAYPLSSESGG